MLLAELDHGAAAFTRKLCLEAAGLVVNAGMDDAAVATGLMQRQVRLLFEEKDGEPRLAATQNHGRREADDAAADDGAIEGFVGHVSVSLEPGKRFFGNGTPPPSEWVSWLRCR